VARFRVLRAAIGWAYDERIIDYHPIRTMRGPARSEPRRPVDPDDVARLLTTAEHRLQAAEQDLLMIRIAADSGAANRIDFRTIAEVLVTLEYTALYDADYARQIRATLPTREQGTLALSLRDMFPEAWYRLVEPDPQTPGEIPLVTLPVSLADFPRNLGQVRLDALTLLVVRAGARDDDTPEIAVDHLHLVRGDDRLEGGQPSAYGMCSALASAQSPGSRCCRHPPAGTRPRPATGSWPSRATPTPAPRCALTRSPICFWSSLTERTCRPGQSAAPNPTTPRHPRAGGCQARNWSCPSPTRTYRRVPSSLESPHGRRYRTLRRFVKGRATRRYALSRQTLETVFMACHMC
jgi:hypothetical protein